MKTRMKRSEISGILELINLVERYRPGLGILNAIILAARLGSRWSDIGRGLMVLGWMGWGKGELIMSTSVAHVGFPIFAGSELHPAHVRKVLEGAESRKAPISRLSVIFEDLASMAEDPTKMRRTFNYGSWMISQLMSSHTGYHDDPGEPFTFDSANWICGATPQVMHTIRRQKQWASSWGDRFSRIGIIKTPLDESRIERYESSGPQINASKLREKITALIPPIEDLPNEIPIDIPGPEINAAAARVWGSWAFDPRITRSTRVGDAQHKTRRSRKYLRSDLRGLAVIAGSPTVTHSHLAFLEAASIYYRIGSLHPRDLGLVQLAILGGSVEDLCEETGLSTFVVLDHLRRLQKVGMVRIRGGSKKPWTNQVSAGHYFDDILEDIEGIRVSAGQAGF